MNTTQPKPPSIKQMANRSLDGHRKALRHIAEGKPVVGPTAQMGELRGMRTVLSTLCRWGCVADDYTLTERGEALLTALNEKWTR